MLKKKMLIALGVAAVLSVSCVSVTVWAEENAEEQTEEAEDSSNSCLLYTSPSPRDS